MPTLTMCRGLPGSGKTTWATDQVLRSENLSLVRVNKDAIRLELEVHGWKWSKANERDVVEIRDLRITTALKAGRDVISDDTNFDPSHERRLNNIAYMCGAEFVVKDFPTPIAECIRIDAQRAGTACVGEKVIRAMANRYNYPPLRIRPVEPMDNALPALICDLDGTLALLNGRNPYDASTCENDIVNTPVADILRACYGRFYSILYMSGRQTKYCMQTRSWLCSKDLNFGGTPLFMREAGDTRRDDIVKAELFDRHVRGKYDVRFVLDDRDSVVAMWRAIGLTCLQIAPGDF